MDNQRNIQRIFIQEKLRTKKAYVYNKENNYVVYTLNMLNNIVCKGDNILDIGCGDCRILRYIDEKNVNKFGVDVSADIFPEEILNDIKNNNIEISYIDLEYQKLPYKSKTMDVVISTETIEHILNTDNYISEINRVLKNKGKLLLTFPNINTPISWFIQIFCDLPPFMSSRYKSIHVRDFTLKIVKIILNKYGFKVKTVKGFDIPLMPKFFSDLLCKIHPRFGGGIIISAEKIKDVNIDTSFCMDIRDLLKGNLDD